MKPSFIFWWDPYRYENDKKHAFAKTRQ